MEAEKIDPALCTDYATQGDESDEDWSDLDTAHGGEQNFGQTAKLIVMEKVHENGPKKDWREYFKPYDYDETAYDSSRSYPDDESREKFIHEATLKKKIFDSSALRPTKDTLKEFENSFDDNIFQVVDYRYFNYIEELNTNDHTRYRFPYHRFSSGSLRVYSSGAIKPLGCFIMFSTLVMCVLMFSFWNKYVFMLGGMFLVAYILMNYFSDYFHIDLKKNPEFDNPFDRKTGYVNLGEDGKYGNMKRMDVHFSELDLYYSRTVNPYNRSEDFSVYLLHKYTDHGVFIYNGGSLVEALITYHYIKQFMDIRKPLPDVPLLEPYRRFDKTTREYDERVGRDPNKWRNYDQEQYNKEAKEILKKVESYHKEQKRLYS